MLKVLNKERTNVQERQVTPIQDVIVRKLETTTTEQEDGTTIIQRRYRLVNVTKLSNESKKLVLQNNTTEILKKLDEIKGVYTV